MQKCKKSKGLFHLTNENKRMKRILKIFGVGGHNCKDVADKLEILLDGELNSEEEAFLIKDIKRCSACLEHYNIDKAFKEFVQKKVERKCCTETLKSEILDKIKTISLEDESK
jgi:anti-sigma factor (TIGR02949 family)